MTHQITRPMSHPTAKPTTAHDLCTQLMGQAKAAGMYALSLQDKRIFLDLASAAKKLRKAIDGERRSAAEQRRDAA